MTAVGLGSLASSVEGRASGSSRNGSREALHGTALQTFKSSLSGETFLKCFRDGTETGLEAAFRLSCITLVEGCKEGQQKCDKRPSHSSIVHCLPQGIVTWACS